MAMEDTTIHTNVLSPLSSMHPSSFSTWKHCVSNSFWNYLVVCPVTESPASGPLETATWITFDIPGQRGLTCLLGWFWVYFSLSIFFSFFLSPFFPLKVEQEKMYHKVCACMCAFQREWQPGGEAVCHLSWQTRSSGSQTGLLRRYYLTLKREPAMPHILSGPKKPWQAQQRPWWHQHCIW